MNAAMSGAVVLLAGFVLASLPLLNKRGLFALPLLKTNKAGWLRLVEFLCAYGLWLLIARFFESQLGPIAHQDWQFYTITLMLFVIAAFPAFAWKVLWHGRG